MLSQQGRMAKAVQEAGCDVLFSPGGTLPGGCTVPTVTMSQNMLPFEPMEAALFGRWSFMRLKMRVLRFTQGRSFRRADGVVFLTRYAAAGVTNALGGAVRSFALVPHGIESRFIQAPREPRPLADCSALKPLKLLYVSITMPYKHQLEVAEAIKSLRDEGLPVEMRFVGASWGGYGEQLKQRIQALDPKGEFLRWKGAEPFETLHELYRQSDAFLFASSCENMPNILIEAMAAGLPVACSDRGPMPEVLGDAGVYFDPQSPASIATAVRTLAKDADLRAELSQTAWRKAQDYSWERCARETLQFIAEVGQRVAKPTASSMHFQ
jgi:glycosyltransferase involved in cell wall biosynthesis